MNPISVRSVGMVTPGAANANASVGLIFTETYKADDLPRVSTQPSGLVGAKTPIPDDVVGLERLVQLGAEALWDAVDAELAAKEVGLVVCAPSAAEEPELVGQSEHLLQRLAGESQLSLATAGSRVFANGRDSVFQAMPFAVAALKQPQLAAVCVLGVDSLVTKPRLRLRLQQDEASGEALGEAAAAIVLTRTQESPAMAMLAGLGTTTQSSPSPGKSLLAAIDQSIAGARLNPPSFDLLVHDMVGSPADVEELAWAKTGQAFIGSARMSTLGPYRSVGNVGAASGVLALATTAFLVQKVDAFQTGLCCLSSREQRGAVILHP
jgi:hypothetical protein